MISIFVSLKRVDRIKSPFTHMTLMIAGEMIVLQVGNHMRFLYTNLATDEALEPRQSVHLHLIDVQSQHLAT